MDLKKARTLVNQRVIEVTGALVALKGALQDEADVLKVEQLTGPSYKALEDADMIHRLVQEVGGLRQRRILERRDDA